MPRQPPNQTLQRTTGAVVAELDRCMSRFIMAAVLFLVFMVLAIISTAFVYFLLYGLIVWICSSFGLPSGYSWLPLAITIFVFIIGVTTAIRRRLPDLAQLSWDSGTQQESPSRVYIPGEGGRLWNVNPLGPQSIGSIASIGAGFLCLGPSLAITAIVTAMEEMKKSNNHQVSRRRPLSHRGCAAGGSHSIRFL